jgi:hypothetical protein
MNSIKHSLNSLKLLIPLTLLTALFALASCGDDFLDTAPQSEISASQLDEIAAADPAAVLGAKMQGVYSNLYKRNVCESGLATDFGQKAFDIFTDLMTGDMGAASTGGISSFAPVISFVNQVSTHPENEIVWTFYYKIIKGANEIIDLTGGDEASPADDTQKTYRAQAKAIRAYACFYLVNLYQHPYSDSKNSPAIPLYRSQINSAPAAKSSVAEVYSLIIDDLEYAVAALEGYDRGANKIVIDKFVAAALLANAYLNRGETGDYEKAAYYAGLVIDSGKFPLLTPSQTTESGFNTVCDNWIWGAEVSAANSQFFYCFFGHIDYYSYSMAFLGFIKEIDAALYRSIPATDVRRKQFGNPSTQTEGATPLAPFRKFFDAGRTPGGDQSYTADNLFIRAEEMVLIRAEALARLGNLPESLNSLNSLISLRNPAATLENLSQEDLLEQIWFNWRVEMWGEGKTYFAMKRYEKTMQRSENHAYFAGQEFPYNYERMIFEIPQKEIINNPNLK